MCSLKKNILSTSPSTNAISVLRLFSVVSDSRYLLIKSDGSIPLTLFLFFKISSEVGLQKSGQH